MENKKIFRFLNLGFIVFAIILWFYLGKVGKFRGFAFLPLIPIIISSIFLRKYKKDE